MYLDKLANGSDLSNAEFNKFDGLLFRYININTIREKTNTCDIYFSFPFMRGLYINFYERYICP